MPIATGPDIGLLPDLTFAVESIEKAKGGCNPKNIDLKI
jgi:hypothetical protein